MLLDTVFTVFRLLTDFVCLYNYEFWLSLCKIVRSSVILLLPLLAFQFFDLESTWWRLYQKRIVHTKFDVYVYIIYEYYQWIEVHAIGLLARYNPHSCFDIHIVFGYIYIWTLHFLNDGIKWQLRSVCLWHIQAYSRVFAWVRVVQPFYYIFYLVYLCTTFMSKCYNYL